MSVSGHSRHRQRDGRIVTIARSWDEVHVAARYHLREWGEHSRPEHELHGVHEDAGGLTVEHVPAEQAPTGGPEFRITFADGASVTTPGADVVLAYLEQARAVGRSAG